MTETYGTQCVLSSSEFVIETGFNVVNRMATHLENLETWTSLKLIREKSGKLWFACALWYATGVAVVK